MMFGSSCILALLSLTSTCSASILKRTEATNGFVNLEQRQTPTAPVGQDAQVIINAITDIGQKLAAANSTVVSFTGGGIDGITGLISVNEAVVDLGNSIEAATNTAQQSPVLPAQDSATVGIQFLFLQPNINLLLNNLVQKQPGFDTAAFGLLDTRSLIHDSLVNQQSGAKALGSGLIAKLDPSLTGIATPINDQIQGNFTQAVTAWDGRSGLIKIPTALVPTVSDLLAKFGDTLNGILGFLDKRRADGYCCGITQAKIDSLGPDESSTDGVPGPIVFFLRAAGFDLR